jgi:hypothetical protein
MEGVQPMQTPIRRLRGPGVAGGFAVLLGVFLWQLGIAFERAWLQSYDGPLLGETVEDHGGLPQSDQLGQASPAVGKRRRWVAHHHSRVVRSAARVARSGNG